MILKDIESRGLVQFNKEYLDEEFFKNFIKFRKSFSHSMSELISKLDTFETKNEEMSNFIIYSELSYINSHLDAVKKFLKNSSSRYSLLNCTSPRDSMSFRIMRVAL